MIELIGWYGTVAIISTYFLNSFGRMSSDSKLYQILNLTGAIGIVAVSVSKSAWQPAVLNAIWAIIGVSALFRIMRSEKKSA